MLKWKKYCLNFYIGFKKFNLIFFNILLISITFLIFSQSIWELHFKRPGIEGSFKKKFIVKPNQSCDKIAKDLEDGKIVSSHSIFKKWAVIWGVDRYLKAGKYQFSKEKSLFQVLTRLSNYITFMENVFIREGLTLDEVAQKMVTLDIKKEKFISLCYDKKFINSLNIHAPSLEGYLFPDTYQIAYGEKEENIIKMMVKRFFNVVDSIDTHKSIIYKTSGLSKGLIIASIIEKESRYIPERPKVSSVFWNRINKGWRLDSDVTVHYALKDWKKKLTRKDLKISSPFNTRRYKGFPPTPICNPGRSSIEAAFFPEKTDYMFFVASGSKKGDSIFTKNLRKHNKVKKKLKREGKL